MRNKTNQAAAFRVAALLHEDILASSITLPMEILAGAAQALGRGSQQSLRFQCFSKGLRGKHVPACTASGEKQPIRHSHKLQGACE